MQELRLVAVSEDGSYAVLVAPGRSGRFALPIDERLRAVAKGQFSRLAQYEIEVESPLRPKEIQDRIRAGETAEDIADAAGVPVERIRRFEGPVLAEREYQAQQAQRASVRGLGESGPGPRLGEIVAERLAAGGYGADDAEWDSRKRQDGNWQVQLAYTVAGRMQLAEWVFDPRSKHVTADNNQAARLCLPEADWPDGPDGPVELTATVTPIGSRAAAAGLHPGDRPDPDRVAGRGSGHAARQLPIGAAARLGSGRADAADRHPAARSDPALAPVTGELGAETGNPRSAGPEREKPEREKTAARGAAVSRDAGRRRASGAHQASSSPELQELADGPGIGSAEGAEGQDPETAPARPAKRAAGGRSRRSSVPSWDEIMFGNSRQPD